jgi:hypothetical protein
MYHYFPFSQIRRLKLVYLKKCNGNAIKKPERKKLFFFAHHAVKLIACSVDQKVGHLSEDNVALVRLLQSVKIGKL